MAEPTTCPVAAIAYEVEALWMAFVANDERVVALKKGVEHDRLERENSTIMDRRDALEELAAFTRARSLQGAMLQVALAKDAVEAIASYRDEQWASTVDGYRRVVDACLYSVMRLLEEHSGTPREGLGISHYMDRAFDPHPVLAAALAGQPAPTTPEAST